MAVSDPIADMLTMIRNASSAKKEVVEVKKSKISENIIQLLKREGFVSDYRVIEDKKQGLLRIYLKYHEDNTPAITGLKRVSKPSLRSYRGKSSIPSVQSGLGVAIVSTSKGLLTDTEAKAEGMGGEIICYAW
ncbi:MAG: 30S ribosomal protein S8 [Candidatus Omnitrophota bacterium]